MMVVVVIHGHSRAETREKEYVSTEWRATSPKSPNGWHTLVRGGYVMVAFTKL